jgi:hypothetical protein
VGQTLQESDVTFAETAIVVIVYCLPIMENKLLFSVSVCSKQREVCHFCFPFAANEWQLPFTICSVF